MKKILLLFVILAVLSSGVFAYDSGWQNFRTKNSYIVCGKYYNTCSLSTLGLDWYNPINTYAFDIICGELPGKDRRDCLLADQGGMGKYFNVQNGNYYLFYKIVYEAGSASNDENLKGGISSNWGSNGRNIIDLGAGDKQCVFRNTFQVNNANKVWLRGTGGSVNPYSFRLATCIPEISGLVYCDDGTPAVSNCCVPSSEVCNGIDDDCDGLIDEDRVCNKAPVAYDFNVATDENVPMTGMAKCYDSDGDSLKTIVVTRPSYGTVRGNGTQFIGTYTPNTGFYGADKIEYKCNDGIADSNTATVFITVNHVNHAPTAGDIHVIAYESTPVFIPLVCSDIDGDLTLTHNIVNGPSNGVAFINGTKNIENDTVEYIPNLNYVGNDEFTYSCNDGISDSNTAKVTIHVLSVNTAPVAYDFNVATDENVPITSMAKCSDSDGDSLKVIIVTRPTHGTVKGNGTQFIGTYTPNTGFYGADKIEYKCNDGFLDSNIATVIITVNRIECSEDYDCGIDRCSSEPYCSSIEGDVYENRTHFMCINPGTKESYCFNTTKKMMLKNCEDDYYTNNHCSNDWEDLNGDFHNVSCINAECIEEVRNDVLVQDCGESYVTVHYKYCLGNTVYAYMDDFRFGCENPGVCFNNSYFNKTNFVETCKDYCLNGECEYFECHNNSECDDSNASTIDECINPSTPESSCVNTPTTIICSSNCDCGIDGFIGNSFCTSNDVTQNYISFVCNNPGMYNSSCLNSTTLQIKQNCPDYCDNGECEEFICHNDSECDDGNSSTRDECHHPGTNLSHCMYTPIVITCSNDSQCGTDGYSEGLFCIGNNVSQNYVTFSCNNKGTSSSYCSNSTVSLTKIGCSDYCLNGACGIFNCTENSDCDDSNNLTQDVCHNASTPLSYCTNNIIGCFRDSDCGINLLSSDYCSGNNVVQSNTTFICNNAGTDSSYCSNSISYITKQTCSDYCLNATCGSFRCESNADCGNNYAYSFCDRLVYNFVNVNPVCNSPMTPGSYCLNNTQTQQTYCNNFCSASDGCDYMPSNEIYPRRKIYIENIRINNMVYDFVKPGDDLYVDVSFENWGYYDVEKSTIRVTVPELGISYRIGPFNGPELDRNYRKTVPLEIPNDAKPGVYTLRMALTTDEQVKRVRHRDFRVI